MKKYSRIFHSLISSIVGFSLVSSPSIASDNDYKETGTDFEKLVSETLNTSELSNKQLWVVNLSRLESSIAHILQELGIEKCVSGNLYDILEKIITDFNKWEKDNAQEKKEDKTQKKSDFFSYGGSSSYHWNTIVNGTNISLKNVSNFSKKLENIEEKFKLIELETISTLKGKSFARVFLNLCKCKDAIDFMIAECLKTDSQFAELMNELSVIDKNIEEILFSKNVLSLAVDNNTFLQEVGKEYLSKFDQLASKNEM